MDNTSTQPEAVESLFAAQQRAFSGAMAPSHATRLGRLQRLLAMTQQYENEVAKAISADFGNRSSHETALGEIFVTIASINHARRNLRRWMRTRRVSTPLYMLPAKSRGIRQPLGVIGIVSPWNYPFQMSIAPAVAAVAAGNRILIKPSELAPNFSAVLSTAVAQFFAPEEIAVVLGDAETARHFVSLPFDHLFFTGSTAVGRQVAVAAASNLTPVTLELGGKSPAIIDSSCDIADAATKLVAGKMLNAGQVCIAPDYVLLPPNCEDVFVGALRAAMARLYPTLEGNPDYTSIATHRHYARLHHLLEDARSKGARIIEINTGSEKIGSASRKMPLYVVLDVHDEMALMQEEIFGPILPILVAPDASAAIEYVNSHPRPLALYWFGTARSPPPSHDCRGRHRQRHDLAYRTRTAALWRRGPQWHGGLPWRNRIPHLYQREIRVPSIKVQCSATTLPALRADIRAHPEVAQTYRLN